MKRASVAVVIPTYNRAHLLERAIGSVLEQSRPADEIVVIDDGSTDETSRLVGEKFPTVRYLNQPNRGVSAARNLGISETESEWIAFLDSDDEWLADKLKNQLDQLANQDTAQVCHTEEIWVRNGKRVNAMKKHAKKGGWIFHDCLPLCAMSPSSIMINRSVFNSVGLFDESLPACEDYDLWLRICSRYPVLFIEQPQIVKYGGHEDQLSRKFWGMDRFRISALKKVIDAGTLNPDDHNAACDMLVKKAGIYLHGLRKREKEEEARQYETLCQRYSTGLTAQRQP